MPAPSPAMRIGLAALALVAAALPVRGQSTDSLPRDSVPQAQGAVTPGLSAPARSFGSVRHSVDSSDLRRGARPRTLSELLQARLPGVSVLRYGGDPSDGSRVRVRGTVSVLGNPEPVVVLDGIPVSAPQQLGGTTGAASSRLDDVDPEDVERIDVLPGPAATTLFGAGASNGAIVITTKRGVTGPARLTAWSQAALTSEPTAYPANYRQNGVDPVTGAPVASCDVVAIAIRRCTPTTLDVWNPLESASPFRHGRYGAGGASVTGGPFGIRGFASTAVRSETSVLDGSGATRVNGRLNAERALFRGFVVGGNVGYVRREATLRADRVVARGLTGEAVDDANDGYSPTVDTLPFASDGERLTRSAHLGWYALPWLRVNGVVGRDELAQDDLHRSSSGTYLWESTARSWQASSFVHGTAEATHRVARLVRLRTLLSYEEAKRRRKDEEAVILTTDPRV
ncbi:MAG TPA: TonB-dependent receptor plug domain-containing protein, partial [Gemmatimonadaceae bacterium]|nr:TonB-dependent receptor plug domain-containing protein [Gemmatimonadaceae bacterium]